MPNNTAEQIQEISATEFTKKIKSDIAAMSLINTTCNNDTSINQIANEMKIELNNFYNLSEEEQKKVLEEEDNERDIKVKKHLEKQKIYSEHLFSDIENNPKSDEINTKSPETIFIELISLYYTKRNDSSYQHKICEKIIQVELFYYLANTKALPKYKSSMGNDILMLK